MARKRRRLEKIYDSNSACVICGAIKKRKVRRDGQVESLQRFLQRKTCGNDWDGEKYVKSNCLIELQVGEGNPNYKGYMPKCRVCGKRTSYNNADEMEAGITPQYCGKHWLEKMKKDKKGKFPEHLKRYKFPKGHNNLELHKEDCNCIYHRSQRDLDHEET